MPSSSGPGGTARSSKGPRQVESGNSSGASQTVVASGGAAQHTQSKNGSVEEERLARPQGNAAGHTQRSASVERRIAERMVKLRDRFEEDRRQRRGPLWEPKAKPRLQWQWECKLP